MYCDGSVVGAQEGQYVFVFQMPIIGTHRIEARSKDCLDAIIIHKVEKAKPAYILVSSSVVNWFDTPGMDSIPGYFSVQDKMEAIRKDPNYGQVVCRCENVTKAEILAAIHNPLGVSTMTGIKNRTRSMMGRCQGGYCQMRITELLEQELGLKPEDIRYQRENGWFFAGRVREVE